MKLRCYCCGAALKDRFVLVAYANGSVDRVFVFKEEHAKRVDDVAARQIVERAK